MTNSQPDPAPGMCFRIEDMTAEDRDLDPDFTETCALKLVAWWDGEENERGTQIPLNDLTPLPVAIARAVNHLAMFREE